jgi:phage repressor protein C with HTH and peptisase S24 domain
MAKGIGLKIKALREALGESQTAFAHRFGVEQASVSRWERETSPVQRKFQKQMAEIANTSVAEFFHSDTAPRVVPIIGSVGAGEKFLPASTTTALEHVDFDIKNDEIVGIRVRGDSMSPVYRDGEILICSRVNRQDLANALNKDCVLETAAGEGYIKILKPGSTPNLFNLRSYNPYFDDIVDVEIKWAAPVLWVYRNV